MKRRRAAKVEYAGFWLRLAAFIIDQIILGGIGFVIGFFIGMMFPAVAIFSTQGFWNIAGIFISWVYYAQLESSSKQATFGKQLMHIKVTDYKNKKISFARASARFFGKIFSGLILGIGFLMIAFTEKKQGLHDIIAGCLVVKSK